MRNGSGSMLMEKQSECKDKLAKPKFENNCGEFCQRGGFKGEGGKVLSGKEGVWTRVKKRKDDR